MAEVHTADDGYCIAECIHGFTSRDCGLQHAGPHYCESAFRKTPEGRYERRTLRSRLFGWLSQNGGSGL